MMGYLFPIIGETSFARRGPEGVMTFFTGAVREKFRAWTCRLVAAKRRSPDENILEAVAALMDKGSVQLRCLAAALESNAVQTR